MRAAAIFGLSASEKDLKPFQKESNVTWLIGLPESSSEADAILIFGGDGTVHRHLAQLVKLQLPVLVVPCGSGNDFARALNLRNIRDALAAWQQFASGRGTVQQIDLGVITPSNAGRAPAPHDPFSRSSGNQKLETGNYFCCVGGVGLDVEVARLANQLPGALRRRGGYLLSLLPALFRFQPPAVEVATQENLLSGFETQYNGPAMLVAFANGPTFGGGLKIAPGAQLGDGKLEVCIVSAMAKSRLLRLFPSLYSGTHVKFREVKYFQAERLRIVTNPPSDVYADGEYICTTPVEIKLERVALRVIVQQT
jgi:diacylglycerol kinase family enzyme